MGTVSRRVAPFAPLAIAMLAQTALLRTGPSATVSEEHPADEAAVCGEEIPSYEECHSEYPNGCSAAARYDAYVNLLKNQLVRPTKRPLRFFTGDELGALEQRLQSLPEELTKTNHIDLMDDLSRLGEGHVVGMVGFLYYVKKGGKESSNCQLTDADDIDLHIGIGFDPQVAAKLASKKKLTSDERSEIHQSSVIVEVTPHWRAQFNPAWTLAAFTPVVGRQVRVVGQLLADSEHYVAKDDCGFADAGSTCWRASIWELHPVTRFEVCNDGDSCTETSRNWVDLEDFGTAAEPVPAGP
jgi:hypothetical protein